MHTTIDYQHLSKRPKIGLAVGIAIALSSIPSWYMGCGAGIHLFWFRFHSHGPGFLVFIAAVILYLLIELTGSLVVAHGFSKTSGFLLLHALAFTSGCSGYMIAALLWR